MINLKYTIKKLDKALRWGYISQSGRNFSGIICVHHRGGGQKKRHYYVDFYRRLNLYGYICKIIKAPFFTGLLALVIYQNGISSYIILSETSRIGSRIYSGTLVMNEKDLYVASSASPLINMPLFVFVNNIEYYPYCGSQIARSAGTSAIVTTKFSDEFLLKLKSGWNLKISKFCLCTYGIVSNSIYRFSNLRKAGKIRALGIRPTVRGVAMNPCDHPHGGGEGKKSPPAAARSPWGRLTKGTPTKVKRYQIIRKKLNKYIK